MPVNFQGIFDEYAKSTERGWEHDRTLTVGASEIGACIRSVFFKKRGRELGFEPDPDFVQSYGATKRGSVLEAHYVVPALLSGVPDGAELLWAGDDQRTLIRERRSATPDGLLVGAPADSLIDYGIDDIEADCFAIEIKTFDSRINLEEPKPVHIWQVQQQLGLIHEETNHRPEYAVILYVNAAWVDDIRPFVIKRDPSMYEACKKRSDMVYVATDPAKLVAEGKLTGGKECAYCAFTNACAFATLGTVPTEKREDLRFTPTEEEELIELIRTERRFKAAEDQAKEQKTTAAEAIKQWLRDRKTRWAKVRGGFSANYNIVPGRKSYDYKRMIEDGIDLDPYIKEGSGSERLTVKAPGGSDDE